MDVTAMLLPNFAGRKPEHTARIDRLQRQTAIHQGIEHAIERHPVGIEQQGFKVGVTHRLYRSQQRIEDAHAARRDFDASIAQEIAGCGHG